MDHSLAAYLPQDRRLALARGENLPDRTAGAALTAVFELEPIEPIPLKGMPEPLPIFRLAGLRRQEVRLTEPSYALPMVGRAASLL